jgi:hypothetical protein
MVGRESIKEEVDPKGKVKKKYPFDSIQNFN